jgi:hypothetical protein
MPPKTGRPASYDPLAADRCACSHLVYTDDEPGGECRWDLCHCTNHQSANRPGPDVLHDQDSRFEERGVSGYEL